MERLSYILQTIVEATKKQDLDGQYLGPYKTSLQVYALQMKGRWESNINVWFQLINVFSEVKLGALVISITEL